VFNEIKNSIIRAVTLAPFKPEDKILVQTDASNTGLGVVVLQNNRSVAYASRLLSDNEQLYSSIERECLAIVYACKKYHCYFWNKQVTIQTDHKPLIFLFEKSIDKLPLGRLRSLRVKVLNYNIELQYLPARFLHMPDCLSRATSNCAEPEKLDVMIHSHVVTLPMSEQRLKDFQCAVSQDKILTQVVKCCQQGWPKDERTLNDELRNFWELKDSLSVENGLVFFEDRLVVPLSKREYILSRVHEGHQGETRCKAIVRKHFFWHSMTKDIELFVKKRDICQRAGPSNRRQPLMPHRVPDRSFQEISVDLAQCLSKTYLVLVDHFSKWMEVKLLQSKTAKAVISVLRPARHT